MTRQEIQKPARTDVRVIAATNRDLSMAVQEGKFRTDLYYRRNVFPINIPILKQREDDIPLLAEHFVSRFSVRMGRKIDSLSVECFERLKAYDWPGNVRELQNVIERGVITARQGRLNLDHALPGHMNCKNFAKQKPPENSVKTVLQLQQQESENLLLAIKISQWQIGGKKGAARLGRYATNSNCFPIANEGYGDKAPTLSLPPKNNASQELPFYRNLVVSSHEISLPTKSRRTGIHLLRKSII